MALIDNIVNAITAAANSATANKNSAVNQANAARGANDTTPKCLEGMNQLDGARASATAAHDDSGTAAGLLQALNLIAVVNLVGAVPTAQQLTTANTDATTAANAATAADTSIAQAEPAVITAHDNCILSSLTAAIEACVISGTTAAKNATTGLSNPLDPNDVNKYQLDSLVTTMIQTAATYNPTFGGGCNEGVSVLQQIARLIQDKTNAADLPKLQDCIDQLSAVSPQDPVLQGIMINGQNIIPQQAHNDVQTILTNAQTILFDTSNPGVQTIWRKRIVSTVPKIDINVHVMDHEMDDLEGSVSVNVLNFPLNQLIPLPELPLPMVPSTNNSGRATVKGVPLAPMPMPLPGGSPGVPPPPTNLPLLDFATLQFTVAPPNRATGTTSQPVTDAGLLNGNVEVQIVVPDTSLSS